MADNRNWIRHLLTVVNVLLFLGSSSMIILGVYIQKKKSMYLPDFEMTEFGGPHVIVMIGAMSAAVALLGAQAACSRSRCLLFLYASVLIILTIVLSTMALLIYSRRKDIEREIEECLTSRLIDYRMDRNVRHHQAIDNMQVQFKCCGIRRYDDWTKSTYFQPQAAVPDYCCHQTVEGCGIGMTSRLEHEAAEFIYTEGCLVKMNNELGESKTLAVGIGLSAFMLLLIGALTTCVIACEPMTIQEPDTELITLR